MTPEDSAFALRHTVALLLDEHTKFRPFGSGCLVAVAERWFVLTAAHLFDQDDWRGRMVVASSPLNTEPGPADIQSGETLRLVPSGPDPTMLCHWETDAAAFEVTPLDDRTAKLLPAVAVPPQVIVASTRANSPQAWATDAFCLCGFPGALASQLMDAAAFHGALTLELSLVRERVSRKLWTENPEALFLAAHGAQANGETIAPFPLAGASGGTQWATAPGREPALVATHRGSVIVGSGWFTTGAPVGIHVSMIATAFPELRPFIEQHWPGALGYKIAPDVGA